MNLEFDLPDEASTTDLGAALAALLDGRGTVFLDGELGAGKTTLSRGMLRAMGHTGAVKSPTFTLVEPYVLGSHKIYHFDLYRLEDPEELEYIGVDVFCGGEPLCLIEWREKGRGYLPECDLRVELTHRGRGRLARMESKTKRGERMLIELINAKKEEEVRKRLSAVDFARQNADNQRESPVRSSF